MADIQLTPVLSPTPVRRPRPFRAFYYTSLRDKDAGWARIGHACTLVGAVRAAVVKVFLGQYERVDIVGESGLRVALVRRSKQEVKIISVVELSGAK